MSTALHEINVSTLKGVGKAIQNKLEKLGITSLQDLLFHLPHNYQDRTKITSISELQSGKASVFQGTITSARIESGRRKSLACSLNDETGIIFLRFYYFTHSQKKQLAPGVSIRCFGEPRRGITGYEVYHPEYQFIQSANHSIAEDHLTPVYPSTEGLTQSRMRNLCSQALVFLTHSKGLQELLPSFVQEELNLWPLVKSVHYLHAPPPEADTKLLLAGTHPAQKRLGFEELLAHHLSLKKIRKKTHSTVAPSLTSYQQLTHAFCQKLPFELTSAQKRVFSEVSKDLKKSVPMLRLIQGDVGSGKTVVAALAALQAVENHYQAVFMAPTEILAEQHWKNLTHWLNPLGINVALLTGKVKGKALQAQLSSIRNGQAQIITGTHALFQEGVEFHRAGLMIIDEQHRFGVHQRMALANKGKHAEDLFPHQLIMTATPIPRTLAMSVYANLDCSIIDELPPGRTPVCTVTINDARREDVVERVYQACNQGRQAYWVCTLIDESETLQCQAAEVTAAKLHDLLPTLSIGLVHGRMKPQDKNKVVQAFKDKKIDLLVATTVIEVGVDVPNASLMIIENSERLGLSQLHQLRGRVGRGSIESYCVLMYKEPLSQQGRERLKIMRDTQDGFVIAEKDLFLRGPGEVLGARQTGAIQFKIAQLERDHYLLPLVHKAAKSIQSHAPYLVEPLVKRWLPGGKQYLNV